MKKNWFRLRNYTHFLPPLQPSQSGFILNHIKDPKKIIAHKFFPLIHYTISATSYRRRSTGGVKSKKRASKSKERQIFYANHLDAQIYAWYSKQLGDILEELYAKEPRLNSSVSAYRAIPHSNGRNKCNIDFAGEVFGHIRNSSSDELAVVCLDIKGFFDSLDHKILKKEWSELLGLKTLPKDHYAIFKSLVKFSYVEIGDLIKEFSELKIKRLSFLKHKGVLSFCKNVKEFRDRVVSKGLIKHEGFGTDCGIPQGTPISAMLSNIYMISFDRKMNELSSAKNGLYRRYSDDIIIICDPKDIIEIQKSAEIFISSRLKLTIQKAKTQVVTFKGLQTKSVTFSSYENGEKINRPLQYLGFEFDGKTILLKQSGLSKYYRGAKRMINRRAHYALIAKKKGLRQEKIIDDWIYREGIYKRQTHLGAKVKSIRKKIFWGNYLSYVYNASNILKEPKIRSQLRNHWKIIEGEISKFEENYKLKTTPSKRNRRKD